MLPDTTKTNLWYEFDRYIFAPMLKRFDKFKNVLKLFGQYVCEYKCLFPFPNVAKL